MHAAGASCSNVIHLVVFLFFSGVFSSSWVTSTSSAGHKEPSHEREPSASFALHTLAVVTRRYVIYLKRAALTDTSGAAECSTSLNPSSKLLNMNSASLLVEKKTSRRGCFCFDEGLFYPVRVCVCVNAPACLFAHTAAASALCTINFYTVAALARSQQHRRVGESANRRGGGGSGFSFVFLFSGLFGSRRRSYHPISDPSIPD